MKRKIILILGSIALGILAFIFILGNINNSSMDEVINQLTATKLYDSSNNVSNFNSSIKEYEIKDSDDVKAFFQISGDTSGMTFRITAEEDIDMQGKPVSKMAKFSGTLIGNSTYINNLSFAEREDDAYAFIEELDNGAIIRDININGITTNEKHNAYNTTSNGYVHFIRTIDSGAMLYKATFKNITLGCGKTDFTYYAYGYDDCALVGINNGLISHCTLLGDDSTGLYPYPDRVLNRFYALKHASIFASIGGSASSIERCSAFSTTVYGMQYAASLVAEQTNSYLTSCLAESCYVATIPSDALVDGLYTTIENTYYKDTLENYVGGLVGKSINSTVVLNIFNGANAYMLYDENNPIATIESTAGTTRIGGLLGYARGGSVDYNLIEASIQVKYVLGVSKANQVTNIVRGDGDASATKYCNYIDTPIDESDTAYFIDVSNGTDTIRTYGLYESLLFSVCPTSNPEDPDLTTLSYLNEKDERAYFAFNKGHGNEDKVQTIYDIINPNEYKVYKPYYEHLSDHIYIFDDESNQSYSMNTTYLKEEEYYNDFINQGDNIFKVVEKKNSGYSEVNAYKRITVASDMITLEFTVPLDSLDKYYVAYYDAAAKSYTYYDSTYDPYEVLEGGYYFICDSDNQSKLSRIIGQKEAYRNIHNTCRSYDSENTLLSDDTSHILYGDQTVRICDRMWIFGTKPINYAKNNDLTYKKESPYALSYSYTQYMQEMSSFIEMNINDFEEMDIQSMNAVANYRNYSVYYNFKKQASISITGSIQMDKTDLTEFSFAFVNPNGEALNSEFITSEINSDDLTYSITITPDQSLEYDKIFVVLNYLNNDVDDFKNLATLESLMAFKGDADSLHMVMINAEFSGEDELEDQIDEDYKYMIYFYPMQGSSDPDKYYYSVVQLAQGVLSETLYPHGYPFNPLNDSYTLAQDKTLQFDYTTYGVRGYLFDRENNTFYFNVNNNLHNIFSSRNWSTNISISLIDRYYKIYEYWNSDLVDVVSGKVYKCHDKSFIDSIFYEEESGLFEHNYTFRTSNATEAIPKQFETKNRYLNDEVKSFMIIDIKYYTSYDPNNVSASVEYTGEIANLAQDIYCVYTLAIAKSEGTEYEYTYYDTSLGVNTGTALDANCFEFVFSSSIDSPENQIDEVLISQYDEGTNKVLSVYIPKGITAYLWVLVYTDETKETLSNTYFAQTLSYIYDAHLSNLTFHQVSIETEATETYNFEFTYSCGAKKDYALTKDNAFSTYVLEGVRHEVQFESFTGYEIQSTSQEHTFTKGGYVFTPYESLSINVEKTLAYYHIYYYWTSIFQMEIELSNEEGPFFVNDLAQGTLDANWSSYDNLTYEGFDLVYTMNSTQIDYFLEEKALKACKYGSEDFTGFLINKKIYKYYNPSTHSGVLFDRAPEPSDCRDIYVVYDIATPEDIYSLYHYNTYSVAKEVTYNENTYQYNSGYEFGFSSEKFTYRETEATYDVKDSGSYFEVTYCPSSAYLWAIIDDDTLEQDPKTPILEDVTSDFTIYKCWFSQNHVTDELSLTLTLRNSTQETMPIVFDAYAFFIKDCSISIDLTFYDEIGKHASITEGGNFSNSGTYTGLVKDTYIGITLGYNSYSIYYSWSDAGTITLDDGITASSIDLSWMIDHRTWASENGFTYTVENPEADLNYYLNLNKMFSFVREGQTEDIDVLIASMHFYKDEEHTLEYGEKPTKPVVGNIYVTIDLAFPSDSERIYQTKTIGEVKVNGEEGDYSFMTSTMEYYFDESNVGASVLQGNTLYYYVTDDVSLWLIMDGNPICAIDLNQDVISCDYYAIRIADYDGDGYGINYNVSINGMSASEGDSGDERFFYVTAGDTFEAEFQYDGEDGYEYDQIDNTFPIERNKVRLENVHQAYNIVPNFDYKKSHYRIYFYIDKEDILDDPNFSFDRLFDENPTFNAETYVMAEFESVLPAYPSISKEGYRLVGYWIYDVNQDIYVDGDELVPSHNIVAYGEWVEAGKASFEISFYNEAHEKTQFDEDVISIDSIQLYYVDKTTEERSLMEQLASNVNNIDTMQYKVSVTEVMDGGYFYRYQFYFFPTDTDDGNLEVYLKLPYASEFTYFATLNNISSGNEFELQYIKSTITNQDSQDTESHIEVLGTGWYFVDDVVTLTLDIEDGYYAYFTDSDLSKLVNIYNSNTIRIASILEIYLETGSLDIALTVDKRQYHIYYYLDGNLVHTDDYYSGDQVTIWEPGDDILGGYRKSDWNEEIDIMPASNVTLYASIIYGITKEYQINFSSVVEEGMFFIADNKEEITAKTIIREAILLGDNRIEVTYKENQGFLWMVDPITKTARYLDLDLDSITEINLIKYSIPNEIKHLSVSNLGYHLANVLVGLEVTPEPGYTFATLESKFNNIVFVSSKDNDYIVDLREEKLSYSVYYLIKDTLVHEDEFYFGDPIEIWEYDPNTYQGEFNFLAWSSIPFTLMPASDILIYGQEGVSYSLITTPNVSTLHENETLGKAEFSGGLIKVGNETLKGTFRFKDEAYVVRKSDSSNTLFDVIFQPDNLSLAPFEFQMTILVCNPRYDLELNDIYVISKTNNSISLHINEKYEFHVENGAYEEGRDLVLSNLAENTVYTITYRYKADESYCASLEYELKVRTLSYDEMLYINSCAFGLDVIDSAISYFDNPTVQKYLSYFQAKLSMDYAMEMNGEEAQDYVAFLAEVIGMLQEIEEARIPVSHLDANRILDYANRRIDELADLAFLDNVSPKELSRYKNYVINVLNVSDSIISFYNISLGDLVHHNSYTKLVALDTPTLDILNQTSFVINKVDELFDYDYSNYSHVNLDEYKDNYIGKTVDLMSSVQAEVHHTDNQMVTQNISRCVTQVQVLTYEDYTFNREEYDKLFFKAAEAAVVAHMQVIVLFNLDESYQYKVAYIRDYAKAEALKNVYLGLKEEYSDFDTFYLEYKAMIEAGTDMTYDDCIKEFDTMLEDMLVVPTNSGLTSVEITIIFLFATALFVVFAVFVIRYFVRRRLAYASRS